MSYKKTDTFLYGNLQCQQLTKDPLNTKEPIRLCRRDTLSQAKQRLIQAGISKSSGERLLSPAAQEDFHTYTSNIENYIGTVSVPVGIAGPLHIKGSYAKGEYYIPFATTEAALVASYNRGLQLIQACGGAVSMAVNRGVKRSPLFKFNSVIEASQFVVWIQQNVEKLKEVAEVTTRHGKLLSIDWHIESNLVLLIFSYTTGNAAGQNMVTIATDAAYTYILKNCPINANFHVLEGNGSGDKKVSSTSMIGVRGYKICVEVVLKRALVNKYMHIEPELMVEYSCATSSISLMMMTIGNQGHLANALAAIFLACGQDIACVAEAAVGISKCEMIDKDHFYFSITMPNIIVGTVGGGTHLPDQQACLELIGLKDTENPAAEFAEIIAGACLAGEISLVAAICGNYFSRSHRVLARSRKQRFANA